MILITHEDVHSKKSHTHFPWVDFLHLELSTEKWRYRRIYSQKEKTKLFTSQKEIQGSEEEEARALCSL